MKPEDEALMLVHNLFAHPVMEICYWAGFILPPARDFGNWLHGATIPENGRESR